MLAAASIAQLMNIKSILLQIKEQDYMLALPTLKGASVGKHVRHVVEFYQCLLFAATNNMVNYDDRKRNLMLEQNVKYTIDYITEIADTIERMQGNEPLTLVSNYNQQQITMESCMYRELAYNIEHTVHHLAIISIAIPLYFPYINLDEKIGYADSTIQYMKTQLINCQ
jgi:hypothetical protein